MEFLSFLGVAFVVQLTLAILIEVLRDLFSAHRRSLASKVNLPNSSILIGRTVVAKLLHWAAVDYRLRARTGPPERLAAFGQDQPTDPSHLVVFVRGTFGAGGYGHQWERVAETVRATYPKAAFFCFFWAGRNSERSRRQEGDVLAKSLALLVKQYPDTRVIAIGHSHGGNVIEHACRLIAASVRITTVLLATPQLEYTEKCADLSHAHLTAMLYASALFIPAFLAHVLGWVLAAHGFNALHEWNANWFLPAGTVVVAAVFAIRPFALRARETLGARLPQVRHRTHRIWCHGDEVLELFRATDALRSATDALRKVAVSRVEKLHLERWWSALGWELLICAACWLLMDLGVRELARTDPGALHPTIREPGSLRDLSVVLAALFLKLLVYGRPRLYRAVASITSLVLFAMNVGWAHVCRVSLAGLSFVEGILVEVIHREPVNDGSTQFEVSGQLSADWKMSIHRSLNSEAVLAAVKKVISTP